MMTDGTALPPEAARASPAASGDVCAELASEPGAEITGEAAEEFGIELEPEEDPDDPAPAFAGDDAAPTRSTPMAVGGIGKGGAKSAATSAASVATEPCAAEVRASCSNSASTMAARLTGPVG